MDIRHWRRCVTYIKALHVCHSTSNRIKFLSCLADMGTILQKNTQFKKLKKNVIANHVTNVATDLADILHSFSMVKDEDRRNEGDINHSTILTKKESTL